MTILTTQDKEKVKRAVPKASNKIIDATVAKLYVAHPDHTQWTFTGLMGAVALVDDLVGHTFFLKLVDITGARGVLWDQELYVGFEYHQDRTFFHTFELDDCLAGLLFEDTHDAAHFFKRVTTRHKHASKQTANNKNAVALKDRLAPEEEKKGARGEYVDVVTGQRSRRARGVLYYDDQPPVEWRSLYAELASAGISEDMIAENRQFIKDYIAQQGGPLVGLEPPIPRRFGGAPTRTSSIGTNHSSAAPVIPKKTKKAPPPPPPAGSSTISSTVSPSPPPSYSVDSPPRGQSQLSEQSQSQLSQQNPSDSDAESAEDTFSDQPKEPEKPRFRLPPANAPIPKVSHSNIAPPSPGQPPFTAQQPYQNTPVANAPPQSVMSAPPLTQARTGSRPGPPPPPRGARPGPPPPPRASSGGSGAGAPPPPPPPRAVGGAPPPPPSRASRPVPAPAAYVPAAYPSAASVAAPIPASAPPQGPPGHAGPPPPQRDYGGIQTPAVQTVPAHAQAAPVPPPLPPLSAAPSQNPVGGAPPPPPPPPNQPLFAATPAPPPLPPMGAGAPPPPPLPAMGADSVDTPAAPLPAVDSSRDALLASIRGSGLGMLKKTDKSQLEKPNVLLQEARGEPVSVPSSSVPGAGTGQPETLADALASALNKRKNKVADSDDDDDNDEW